MATLKDQLIADAELFVSPDDDVTPFAEDVIYDPDGVAKTVRAVVDLPLDVDLGQYVDSELTFMVRSDPTAGIASPKVGDIWQVRGKNRRAIAPLTTDPDGFHEIRVTSAAAP